MSNYTLKSKLKHDGDEYQPGEVVELDDKVAAAMPWAATKDDAEIKAAYKKQEPWAVKAVESKATAKPKPAAGDDKKEPAKT